MWWLLCLIRRNEQILGTKVQVSKQPGAMTVIGDDPKKFAAAMVEYSQGGGAHKVSVQHTPIKHITHTVWSLF